MPLNVQYIFVSRERPVGDWQAEKEGGNEVIGRPDESGYSFLI